MQDFCVSIINALEIVQSCTKPSWCQFTCHFITAIWSISSFSCVLNLGRRWHGKALFTLRSCNGKAINPYQKFIILEMLKQWDIQSRLLGNNINPGACLFELNRAWCFMIDISNNTWLLWILFNHKYASLWVTQWFYFLPPLTWSKLHRKQWILLLTNHCVIVV